MSTKIMRMDHVPPAVKFSPAALEAVFRQAKEDGYKNLTKEAGIVFRTAPDTAYAILPSVPVPSLMRGPSPAEREHKAAVPGVFKGIPRAYAGDGTCPPGFHRLQDGPAGHPPPGRKHTLTKTTC